jgi:hypothetical protein
VISIRGSKSVFRKKPFLNDRLRHDTMIRDWPDAEWTVMSNSPEPDVGLGTASYRNAGSYRPSIRPQPHPHLTGGFASNVAHRANDLWPTSAK